MPIISPTAISPHRIGGAKNWSSYWATLISATVENAAPTHVVLTFPVAKEDLVTTDFSVTIDGETSAISDATWVGVVLTLTIADTIVYGDTVIVTFEKSGGTKTVTNNTLADYYVRTDGSNTSPYDTPAKGANAIDTVMTYIHNNGDGSGAVVSIGEGTFSGANIYFQSANQDNVKVVGVSSTTTIIEVNNRVIYHTLADDIFVKRLTARTLSTTQEIYYAANEGKTITLKGVIFETPVSYNDYEIQNLGNNLNMYNCIFKGRGANRAQVYMRGGSNGYFYKCKSVANVGSPYNSIGWAMASTGTINIDHCNLLDFRTSGLIVSAGTVNVKNSIIAAGYKYASNQYSITRSAGTLTVSNCLVFGNIYYPETPINGEFTDGGGNVFINTNPKFKNYARKGYILPRVDDNGNSAYAANLGSLLAAKGFSGSFYIYGHNLTAPILVDLKTAISTGGMEIGCHSYSHSDISLTGKIFDVTKAAETITIDRTADSITLSGGGTVSGFKAKTLAVIKTELEGLGATVTAAAIYGAAGDGYITSNALGEVIAGGIAVNQIDLLIDNTAATGYYKSELADAKDLITAFINSDGDVTDPYTGVTYECRTYEAPYGKSSADARLALIAAGYDAACSGPVIMTDESIYSSTEIDLFSVPGIGSGWLTDKSEAAVRSNARLLAFAAAQCGKIILTVSHGETSYESWEWALDEWKKFGSDIKVCSVQEFADDIKAGDWTDVGDGTYTRTYDDDADYELESDSQLIGMADDGGNIGAY